MPHRTRPQVPQYCRQHFRKRGDVAFVKIEGKRTYLGRYGSRESRERYQRIIARWLTGQDAQPRKVSVDGPTMAEVMAAYLRHVRRYYVAPNGEPTQTQNRIKQAMRGVKLTYRSTPACDFGPLALQTVRQHWIDAGLCRSTINERVADVRRMFKWATASSQQPHLKPSSWPARYSSRYDNTYPWNTFSRCSCPSLTSDLPETEAL